MIEYLYSDINNMAKVQLSNVVVLDNPSPFLNPFQFELTFECIEDLNEGICLIIIDSLLFINLGRFIIFIIFSRLGMENDLCWFC